VNPRHRRGLRRLPEAGRRGPRGRIGWHQLPRPPGFFAVRTFGPIDLTLLFLIVFVAFMQLVIYFGTVEVDALATTTVFGLTLVPIAWVYNSPTTTAT
jgi:hypothetical protein